MGYLGHIWETVLAGVLVVSAIGCSLVSGAGLVDCRVASGVRSGSTHHDLRRLPSAHLLQLDRIKPLMVLRGGQKDATPGASSASGPDNFVRLHYYSGWDKVFAHYSRNGGETWTIKPEMLERKEKISPDQEVDPILVEGSSAGLKWRHLSIPMMPDESLRIVLHNGQGSWDSTPFEAPESQTYYIVESPGDFCLKDGILTKVDKEFPAVLLVTDLDGTLVGDEGALIEFKDEWQRQLAHRQSVLVYNTGRSINSTLDLMRDQNLLVPSAVIGSVGTDIVWFRPDGSYRRDADWQKHLVGGGKWNRDKVCQLAQPFVQKEWMHFRPEDEQNDYKVVFGARTEHVQDIIAAIRKGLDAEGLKAKLIYSGHGEWNYLDVVCEGAGKLEAMLYVRKKLKFPANATVACGDSGNDILMLSGEERGVVVGNAQPGLLEWVKSHKNGHEGREADAGARLFCATMGHARGILEGLRQMGFCAKQ